MKIKDKKKNTPAIDFIIAPELNGKYDNEPLFKEKVEKANEILKKTGISKF